MDVKNCSEATLEYSDLVGEASANSTFARSTLANDRRAALEATRDFDKIDAQAQVAAATAAKLCPKNTSFVELTEASRQFGALRGRWDAYRHYAGKMTPPKPGNPGDIFKIMKEYTPQVVSAGRRHWNALVAIAPQPISSSGIVKPKL